MYTGGCLCGAVRYEVRGPLRDVIACHCNECRRSSSHYVAATAAHREHLSMTESKGLAWYSSSQYLRRGFCKLCGSTLFFDHGDGKPTGIAAGSLDQDPGLKLAVHIYVDEAGRYFDIGDDSVPQMDTQTWRATGWDNMKWTADIE